MNSDLLRSFIFLQSGLTFGSVLVIEVQELDTKM